MIYNITHSSIYVTGTEEEERDIGQPLIRAPVVTSAGFSRRHTVDGVSKGLDGPLDTSKNGEASSAGLEFDVTCVRYWFDQ